MPDLIVNNRNKINASNPGNNLKGLRILPSLFDEFTVPMLVFTIDSSELCRGASKVSREDVEVLKENRGTYLGM
jgi:hypothetical protein